VVLTTSAGLRLGKKSGAAFPIPRSYELEAYDVLSLQALRALLDLELDSLSLIERLIAVGLNGRKVYENVLAGLALDESVSLAGIEPLYCSLFFHFGVTSLI
jgi:hypothetical protein